MSSMDKMWMSFIAMGLMIVASVLVLFTRTKVRNRLIRFVSTLAAVVLFFYGIVFMFVSL